MTILKWAESPIPLSDEKNLRITIFLILKANMIDQEREINKKILMS